MLIKGRNRRGDEIAPPLRRGERRLCRRASDLSRMAARRLTLGGASVCFECLADVAFGVRGLRFVIPSVFPGPAGNREEKSGEEEWSLGRGNEHMRGEKVGGLRRERSEKSGTVCKRPGKLGVECVI